MRHKTAIVDGDEIVYKSCKANEEDLPVGDHHILFSDFEQVKYKVDDVLHAVKERTGCGRLVMAFSDQTGKNFRKGLNPAYKNHRRDTRKPLAFARTVEWLKEEYAYMEWPGLEADDVMGVHSQDFDMIVASDKDLKTIPSEIYSIYHDELFEITPEEADWYFLIQTLTGDAVDGYPGCKGVGPVRAAKLLTAAVGESGRIPSDSFERAWIAVQEAYEKAGIPEQAILNARMARILRPGEAQLTDSGVVKIRLYGSETQTSVLHG